MKEFPHAAHPHRTAFRPVATRSVHPHHPPNRKPYRRIPFILPLPRKGRCPLTGSTRLRIGVKTSRRREQSTRCRPGEGPPKKNKQPGNVPRKRLFELAFSHAFALEIVFRLPGI